MTIDLKKVTCGTDVSIVRRRSRESIPAEACYLGQESLILEAKPVEPKSSG
jgi:hypothetical protein